MFSSEITEIRLADALQLWSLSQPQLVADTPTSQVFKVLGAGGSTHALKLLKPYGAAEMIGVDLLEWYAGEGAVQIRARTDTDILMEWLDGETLGDVVRRGCDDLATEELAKVVLRLQQPRRPAPRRLISMAAQCRPFLEGDFDFWPTDLRPLGRQLQHTARELLDSSPTPVPLHGDLHHDNVVRSAAGWQVVDAKGLLGDPAYEFSNIFRNPIGAEQLARDPERIARQADILSDVCACDRSRMLHWAAIHTALSTFWTRNAGNDLTEDFAMVRTMHDVTVGL